MTQIDTAIADNADAIVTCIPDQTMSEAVVAKCEAAGVLIVACDDPLKDGDNNKLAPGSASTPTTSATLPVSGWLTTPPRTI